MSNFAIEVIKVGKCYQRPVANEKKRLEEFWALRDLSFSIPHGQVCGIIGRNGAGKSTLLKLLSRITSPSTGEIQIDGRVGSLLEVGTGFHPELTGRENIFLNGTILGMKTQEIKSRFDEIVEFSGVAAFLDTAVKHYSSGMYTRLAFAVAAHLEPEILIVDEVLAVGDVQFQKKCLNKVKEVSSEGRTVLFVSHSMDTIQALCQMTLLLEHGESRGLMPTSEAISRYLQSSDQESAVTFWRSSDGVGDASISLHAISLQCSEGLAVNSYLRYEDVVTLNYELQLHAATTEHTIGFGLYDESRRLLFWSFQTDTYPDALVKQAHGSLRLTVPLPLDCLQPGRYRVKPLLGLYNQAWILGPDDEGPELIFDLQGVISKSPYWVQARPGLLAPRLTWSVAQNV